MFKIFLSFLSAHQFFKAALVAILSLSFSSISMISMASTTSSTPTTSSDARSSAQSAQFLDVYKSPTCGCCQEWIDHMEAQGFSTNIHHPTALNEIKAKYQIAPALQSCHTAVSPTGYVFEGHIPAKIIQRFLTEEPADAIGLAVPGMPMGSPGMEMGNRFTPYDVLLLKADGSTQVYARINAASEQY